jgi:Protein of unknown function (DUF3450)
MKTPFKKGSFALLALSPALVLAQDPDPAQNAPPANIEAEFMDTLRDIYGLMAYNDLQERQIQAQEVDLLDMQQAIEEIPELERQLPPLLLTMVDQLEDFIEADTPFLLNERRERLANLQTLVERSDVSDAEKLRRIFEAWSIEVEYGGAGNFQIERAQAPDGSMREADFLILGRIALIYQTIDEEGQMGAYDIRNGQWVTLPSSYRSSILQALRMARNQIAPELVLLPTIPPQPQ